VKARKANWLSFFWQIYKSVKQKKPDQRVSRRRKESLRRERVESGKRINRELGLDTTEQDEANER
jgi:hypothetical protein